VIPRRWLLAVAIACGLTSGVVFYVATARADVVVATRDVEVPRALTADDVEVRSLSLDLVPEDAARRTEDVVGLVPRAPLMRGQLVLVRGLAEEAADFRSGATLPVGARAIALPVAATAAVGGAVVPGARVDVLAVPVLGRAPAGRTTELLVSAALVLDVRGESGAPYLATATRPAGAAPDRIASVVLAIDAAEEVRFADRIATSTFVLTLASVR
jgi:Flp pilus assembly protein CpaB